VPNQRRGRVADESARGLDVAHQARLTRVEVGDYRAQPGIMRQLASLLTVEAATTRA
jgi:hypothetical protein